jgi:hypothetical protein
VEDTGGENEGTGVIHTDPLFTGDYELGQGSPCIDAGSPDPEDNDLDGTPNDMGYTGGESGDNTYAGFGIDDPVDLPEEGVTVTFSDVDASGRTWAYSGGQYCGVPAEFKLSDSAVFVDINTDASYTPPITVCLSYNESEYPDETMIQLLHRPDGGEEFVPVEENNVYESENKVCGEVDSLSPFVVAYPACVDGDEDGYGDPGDPSCSAGPQTDCDDSDSGVHPGATEIQCNEIDEDCSGSDYCPSGCMTPAAASTHQVSRVYEAPDLGMHLAFFLLPAGAVIGLIWRRRK